MIAHFSPKYRASTFSDGFIGTFLKFLMSTWKTKTFSIKKIKRILQAVEKLDEVSPNFIIVFQGLREYSKIF